MKIAPNHLFPTKLRFCKFFAVSVFSNWLYSSEGKPETPEIFNSLKTLICIYQVLKDSINIYQKNDFNSVNLNKSQIN